MSGPTRHSVSEFFDRLSVDTDNFHDTFDEYWEKEGRDAFIAGNDKRFGDHAIDVRSVARLAWEAADNRWEDSDEVWNSTQVATVTLAACVFLALVIATIVILVLHSLHLE